MKNDQLSIVRKIMEAGFGNIDLSITDQYVSDRFIEHRFAVTMQLGVFNKKEPVS